MTSPNGLPLFEMAVYAHAPESLSPESLEGMTRAMSRHEVEIRALIPLALELANKAGSSGITIADLRIYAVQRGILTGHEKGRALSYLGNVLRRAGLVATEHLRRSVIERSHGNLNRVFVAPEYARGAA